MRPRLATGVPVRGGRTADACLRRPARGLRCAPTLPATARGHPDAEVLAAGGKGVGVTTPASASDHPRTVYSFQDRTAPVWNFRCGWTPPDRPAGVSRPARRRPVGGPALSRTSSTPAGTKPKASWNERPADGEPVGGRWQECCSRMGHSLGGYDRLVPLTTLDTGGPGGSVMLSDCGREGWPHRAPGTGHRTRAPGSWYAHPRPIAGQLAGEATSRHERPTCRVGSLSASNVLVSEQSLPPADDRGKPRLLSLSPLAVQRSGCPGADAAET